MGTMFATRAGEDPDALPVYVGSHLDTQPTGGKYDGVLGVLGALEVVRSMNDLGIRTRQPIVVTNWTNEEGARFAPAMLASGVFAGVIDLDYAYARTDLGRQDASATSWSGSAGRASEEVGARKMHAYFELHIEQGPILEAEGKRHRRRHPLPGPLVARVHPDRQGGAYRLDADGAAGERRPRDGADHRDGAGGRDGRAARRGRRRRPGQVHARTRATCCRARWSSPSTSARRTRPSSTGCARGSRREAAAICEDLGVGCAVEAVGHFDPVTFAPELVARVRGAAERLGYSHRDIISGAGHDACWAAKVAPATMVMCPCVDGLSHNEAEEITPEWAEKGANVLFHAVVETAEIVS